MSWKDFDILTKDERILVAAQTIEIVRDNTDLEQLIADSGAARGASGPTGPRFDCPFCGASGALVVNAKRKFFYCFGCHEAGAAIDFVMRRHGSTFMEAVWWLAGRLSHD